MISPFFRCARTVLSPHMFSDNAGPTDPGQATWTQAIYFRDAVDNILYGDSNQVWDDLRILKLASVMELFSLEDCAIELIQTAVTKGFLSSYAHGYFVDLLVPPVQGRLMRYRGICGICTQGRPATIYRWQESFPSGMGSALEK